MRRTKIVATVGPASSSAAVLVELIRAGVDVFRLNFSHGTREEHRELFRRIRDAGREAGRPVAILQDLCGPKIRAGEMTDGGVTLQPEQEVTITVRPVMGTSKRFSTQYEALPRDVRPGNRLLLDDGALELEVLDTTAEEVRCRVRRGGVLHTHKGMNLPGTPVSAPSFSEKDRVDLQVGLEEQVDFVAVSFVRCANDVQQVRCEIERGGGHAQVIAKIERPEALEALDEILVAADGLMVARGDLGVEMDVARVPLVQKELIRRAEAADKYVITATQMLESMTHEIRPTRAEVSDVANAIFDGTDAAMLSGETAVGDHPAETVRMMDRIALITEEYLRAQSPATEPSRLNLAHPVLDAIGHAVLRLSRDLRVRAIAAYSATGGTALFLSKSRPSAPIVAFTAEERTLRRMRLFRGVEPVLAGEITSVAELRRRATRHLLDCDLASAGDSMLVVAGTHFGAVGSTDRIEVATIDAADSSSSKGTA